MRKISGLVHKITTPLFQHHGFAKASMILDWEDIVGKNFAGLCRAEKVTFPKGQRRNGCLSICTSSSMATEISYLQPQIIERINRYYGYQAINKIFIRQEPLKPKPVRPEQPSARARSETLSPSLQKQLKGIKHEKLKAALKNFLHYR